MNRILLETAEVDAHNRIVLRDARGRHISRVLRAAPGQSIRVGLVEGPMGTARVEDLQEDAVHLVCTWDDAVPERPAVSLLLALPRPKVMKRLWAPLAALGLDRIILTNAARVERNYFDTHVLEPACYRDRLIEGLQQAGDTRLPRVCVCRRFKVLVEDDLEDLCPGAQRIVAHPDAGIAVSDSVDKTGDVLLAVGPEGGWVEYELALLRAHGFRPAGMGPRTLRTDTACAALVTLVHDALRRVGGVHAHSDGLP